MQCHQLRLIYSTLDSLPKKALAPSRCALSYRHRRDRWPHVFFVSMQDARDGRADVRRRQAHLAGDVADPWSGVRCDRAGSDKAEPLPRRVVAAQLPGAPGAGRWNVEAMTIALFLVRFLPNCPRPVWRLLPRPPADLAKRPQCPHRRPDDLDREMLGCWISPTDLPFPWCKMRDATVPGLEVRTRGRVPESPSTASRHCTVARGSRMEDCAFGSGSQ